MQVVYDPGKVSYRQLQDVFWKNIDPEEYHQKYCQKNPLRCRYYRAGGGRDARLKQMWGK